MVNDLSDFATVDLFRCRLRLREELIFVPQRYKNRTFYHLEIPSSSDFYRIGYAEYIFVSLLDGSTTFAEALAISAQRLGANALSQQKAMAVFNWLVENGLADLCDGADLGPAQIDEDWQSHFTQRANPFWAKFRLFCPDKILKHLAQQLSLLFSLPAFVFSLILFCLGVSSITSQWDRFESASKIVFSTNNWLWLLVAWVILKIAHEFAHGIVCKRYGGHVREMGIVFILFAPLAYVDVTSTWRFPSKWQRIHVALAGIYVELTIASVAAIMWSWTESVLVAHLLFNLIVMASFSTLVCNANPLMRFDGYYVLADLLEIPNLYSEGSQFVSNWAKSLFYGESIERPERLGGSWWMVRVYGVSALFWRIAICLSLLLIAATLFRGAGIVLAMFGVTIWFVVPVKKVLAELSRRYSEERFSFVRAIGVSALLGIVCVGGYFAIPTPSIVSAPGIVDYVDLERLRATSSGFVRRIHVRNGDFVKEGQLLLEIENLDLQVEYQDLLTQIQQSNTRHDIFLNKHQSAEAQVEYRHLSSLHEQLSQIEPEVRGLSIMAPANGKLIARNLLDRLGNYIEKGEELMAIGNENGKEFILSVGQRDVDAVLPRIGHSIRIRIGSRRTFTGILTKVEPRASTTIPHPAMAATVGGALTVLEEKSQESGSHAKWKLTEPRFRAFVEIQEDSAFDIQSGERGHGLIRWRPESIGKTTRFHLSNWFRQRT